MLNIVDLNRLRVFVSVYEHRSLVRASDQLTVTRSAVSQSLALLEDEIGCQLFSRNNKRVIPTPEAEQLYRTMSPLLIQLTENLKNLSAQKQKVGGLIRVGAPMDYGSRVLAAKMAKFIKLYPDVKFQMDLSVPGKQLAKLTKNELDLAVIDNGDFFAKKFPIQVIPLSKEHFVLLGGRKYLAEMRKSPRFSDLIQLQFVDYLAEAPVAKMWFRHHFGKAPVRLDTIFCAESVHAVIAAIKENIGVGVVPRELVEKELKSEILFEIRVGREDFINQMVLAQSQQRVANYSLSQFIKFLL